MKKVLVTIILLLVGYLVWNNYKNTSTQTTNQVVSQSPSPTPIGRKTISYDGIEGKTALELLKANHTVETKTSSYGEYVETIDGIVGGSEGRYWIVYVDGSMASVGADKLVTNPAQKIEWKFETQEENGTK